ncbi:MAG: DesA family fatty acid desaturase [Gammaproteobacteria bacterium]
MQFLYEHFHGLANLNVWGYILVSLAFIHVTLLGITLYYHRDQAHRSVELHPAVRHFFRLWLWINTGANTKEWVAVHRKHHAYCERDGDPHSPALFGLRNIVLEGAEYYQKEAAKPETLAKYGRGTPDDWLERNLYNRWPNLGVAVLVVADLVLFGVPGIIMIAVQLTTMPLLAAGIINGVGHAKGYRNFETEDASTNLWPWALFIAGEELHNNHHAFPSSAKFSQRPWEIDLGWLHLKALSALRLAKIRRIAPQPELVATPKAPDVDALRAVIVNRMHVLRHYTNSVTLPVLRTELDQLGDNAARLARRAKRLLKWQPGFLDRDSQIHLAELIERHPGLKTVLAYRSELTALWEGANTSNERLLADFRDWCARAESSGIEVLRDFARYLKSFEALPEPA